MLTGITPDKFDALLAELAPRHAAAEAKRLGRPGRARKHGAARKFALPLGDRLLMLLVYYRTYVTHAFLAFLFCCDPSSVCRNISPLQPLLAGVFRIPERRVTLSDDEVRELFFRLHRAAGPPAGARRRPAGVLLGQEEAAHGQAPGGGRPQAAAAGPGPGRPDARQAGARPGPDRRVPARGAAGGGRRVSGGAGDAGAAPQAAQGRAAAAEAAREPPAGPPAGRGRARDRQDEGVAGWSPTGIGTSSGGTR